MANKDTLALLPTGGGKSICFQIPGLLKEGVTIVISPLIALIKDQVEQLQKRGVSAAMLVSGMYPREIDIILDNCIYGHTKFLYLSPERLQTNLVKERIKRMNVALIAVDEAHCISQWGYDFRPSYLKINMLRELHPNVPVIALTATATSEVVIDIQDKLLFSDQVVFSQSFGRKNLAYFALNEEDKLDRLFKICTKFKEPGIVYARNRKKTKDLAVFLQKKSISADYYHAGLSPEVRSQKQENWIRNQTRLIVATNAFGMGIDKSNVRFVIHMDLPDSLEAYFQEVGRAGRDGKKAFAILLFDPVDQLNLKKQFETNYPPVDFIKKVYQCIANYYQLAVGSGLGQSFDFDLKVFCSTYDLTPIEVYNAIKILEKEDYFVFSEGIYSASKAKLSLGKDALYTFQVANKKYDTFIKILLRSYSGIFDDYVKVNEYDLSKRVKTSKENIIKALEILDQQEVLSYLPSKTLPQLVFIKERIAPDNVVISPENYQLRKEIALKKLNSVLDYVNATRKCRNQLLLSYFGEEDAKRCGICDICLERNKLELSDLEFSQISTQIKKIISNNPLILNKLVDQLKGKEADTLKVIQWLIDNEKIIHTPEHKLVWNK